MCFYAPLVNARVDGSVGQGLVLGNGRCGGLGGRAFDSDVFDLDVLSLGFTVDEALPGLVAFKHDLMCVSLVLGLTRECKGILRFSICENA